MKTVLAISAIGLSAALTTITGCCCLGDGYSGGGPTGVQPMPQYSAPSYGQPTSPPSYGAPATPGQPAVPQNGIPGSSGGTSQPMNQGGSAPMDQGAGAPMN